VRAELTRHDRRNVPFRQGGAAGFWRRGERQLSRVLRTPWRGPAVPIPSETTASRRLSGRLRARCGEATRRRGTAGFQTGTVDHDPAPVQGIWTAASESGRRDTNRLVTQTLAVGHIRAGRCRSSARNGVTPQSVGMDMESNDPLGKGQREDSPNSMKGCPQRSRPAGHRGVEVAGYEPDSVGVITSSDGPSPPVAPRRAIPPDLPLHS